MQQCKRNISLMSTQSINDVNQQAIFLRKKYSNSSTQNNLDIETVKHVSTRVA